jgi:hypothetical protein
LDKLHFPWRCPIDSGAGGLPSQPCWILFRSEPQDCGDTLKVFHESFKSLQAVGGLPRIDKFKPPASAWVYLVECSSKDCDNAEFGDTPEEAARLWNFANPDWDGNVPVR